MTDRHDPGTPAHGQEPPRSDARPFDIANASPSASAPAAPSDEPFDSAESVSSMSLASLDHHPTDQRPSTSRAADVPARRDPPSTRPRPASDAITDCP